MALRQLTNPPIKEAIISISFSGNVGMEALDNFRQHEYIKKNYPIQHTALSVKVEGQVRRETETNGIVTSPFDASHLPEGYLLISNRKDHNYIVQTKIGQFSFHLTEKYRSWVDFSDEFWKVWSIFSEAVGKSALKNIVLRYVNEITLPLPLPGGFEEYLTFLPQIPEGLNRSVDSFLMQVAMQDDSGMFASMITENFSIESETAIKVLLDINVQRANFNVDSSDDLLEVLESLHAYKNEVFQKCLTEKTLAIYE